MEKAFYGCSKLSGDLVIPSTLKVIHHETFKDCISMSGQLIIPSSIEQIDENAFDETNFTEVVYLGTNKLVCSSSIGLPNKTVIGVSNDFIGNNFCSYEIREVIFNKKPKKGLNIAVIIGISIGSAVVIVVIIIITIVCVRMKKTMKQNNESSTDECDSKSMF